MSQKSRYSEVPLCTCTYMYSIRRVLLKLVNRCDFVEFMTLCFWVGFCFPSLRGAADDKESELFITFLRVRIA